MTLRPHELLYGDREPSYSKPEDHDSHARAHPSEKCALIRQVLADSCWIIRPRCFLTCLLMDCHLLLSQTMVCSFAAESAWPHLRQRRIVKRTVRCRGLKTDMSARRG